MADRALARLRRARTFCASTLARGDGDELCVRKALVRTEMGSASDLARLRSSITRSSCKRRGVREALAAGGGASLTKQKSSKPVDTCKLGMNATGVVCSGVSWLEQS